MVRNAETRKDRHSVDPKSSVRAPPKKSGGGGKFTLGKVGEEGGSAYFADKSDPNFDPDEKRIDPDDDLAYKFNDLAAFYKGKFSKQAIVEYWEWECKPLKPKRTAMSEKAFAGPTLEESAKAKAKERAKTSGKAKAIWEKVSDEVSDKDMDSKGPLAKEIAAVIPYYPYKRLDKFYDIQGLLQHPKLFNSICAVMARRYRRRNITKICAFEARGFLFAAVSIKLGVPFVMLRKDGQMPNTISSAPYTKEYEGVDSICVQRGLIKDGDKVVLLDDLVATGGTLCAGIELVKSLKAEVVECGCMIELKALKGRERCLKAGAKEVWGFISEELLTTKADLPEGYTDDGKP